MRVARLILLNGPPAAGKSTLALRYAHEHPLTLCLDIDAVRGMLGDWMSQPTEAGQLARQIAIEMASVALRSRCDVVVAQFLARIDFIVELEAVAAESGSAFVEIALTGTSQEVLAWFTARSASPETTSHIDAKELLDRSGGVDELQRMVDRWEKLMTSRPNLHRIPARVGDVDSTYEHLEHVLDSIQTVP